MYDALRKQRCFREDLTMMKRYLILTAAALALCGCGKKDNPVPAASAAPENTPDIIQTPAPSVPAEINVPIDYMEEMGSGEDLAVAYLGTASQEISVEQIVSDAYEDGYGIIGQIAEDDIIYGDQGMYYNNVYLLVPAQKTELTVGRYSWYAGEMTESFYSENNSGPIIYVETAESVSPQTLIGYKRHFDDGDTEGWMYTGINVQEGTLRTDFHMGIIDITGYDRFEKDRIPFFSNLYEEALLRLEGVQEKLDERMLMHKLGEAWFDGRMYALYYISDVDDENRTFYGLTYDWSQDTFYYLSDAQIEALMN